MNFDRLKEEYIVKLRWIVQVCIERLDASSHNIVKSKMCQTFQNPGQRDR